MAAWLRCVFLGLWPPPGGRVPEASLVNTRGGDTSGLSLRTALVLFSAFSFVGYGLGCFLSGYVRREFARYGLEGARPWVGLLQVAAAGGLAAGWSWPMLGQAAAGGLALMMLVALGVRWSLRDSFARMLPALGYLALNAYLAATAA